MIHAALKPEKKNGGTWNQTENSETSTTIDYNVDHGPTKLVMLSKHEMFCVDPYSNECHMESGLPASSQNLHFGWAGPWAWDPILSNRP
jgi:hypothetical protein